MINVIMDSGAEYCFDDSVDALKRLIYSETNIGLGNRVSMLRNGIIRLCDGIYVNPTHISSIEEIRDEE